jgi:hypothetical protein
MGADWGVIWCASAEIGMEWGKEEKGGWKDKGKECARLRTATSCLAQHAPTYPPPERPPTPKKVAAGFREMAYSVLRPTALAAVAAAATTTVVAADDHRTIGREIEWH